jgi:hypothetical protein
MAREHDSSMSRYDSLPFGINGLWFEGIFMKCA